MEILLGLDWFGCDYGKYNLHGDKGHVLLEGEPQQTREFIGKVVKESVDNTRRHTMLSSKEDIDELLSQLYVKFQERQIVLKSHSSFVDNYSEYNENRYGDLIPMLVIIEAVPEDLSISSRGIIHTFLKKGHIAGIHLIIASKKNMFPRDNAHVVKLGDKLDPMDIFSAMAPLSKEELNFSIEEFRELSKEDKNIMYSVDVDEEFFNRFKDLEKDLSRISQFFQNSGMTIPASQVDEFIKRRDKFKEDSEELLRQASERIRKLYNREHQELFDKMSKGLGL